jgi:hypothetical protein
MDNLPSLAEFWDLLNAHDWHYEKADDQRTWERGLKEDAKIQQVLALAQEQGESTDYARLHTEWAAFIQGTKDDKPERPI